MRTNGQGASVARTQRQESLPTALLKKLAALPAMIPHGAGALLLANGERRALPADTALRRLMQAPHLVCHAPMLFDRLRHQATGQAPPPRPATHFDLAELFAFACPAVSTPPLPSTFGKVLGLALADDDPAALPQLARALLARLASKDLPARDQAVRLAAMLEKAKWLWAPFVLTILAPQGAPAEFGANPLAVWERLPEWEENPPPPPPGQQPVQPEEAVRELHRILGPGREPRDAQERYAAEVARAFAPRPSQHENIVLLAEAGTGLGKTLGYLAPAALWARRNAGSVWVATYTRNLQRQLMEETRRVWPEPAIHRRRVSVRKGRENYLCLLNAEETFGQLAAGGGPGLVLAALLARWAAVTRDGDLIGGDFPAWLLPLMLPGQPERAHPYALGITDRRGECTYAACRHFRKCFIEKARVRAERAELVIANHAVVLTQAAMNVMLGEITPSQHLDRFALSRIVFDEGHHLFDAADSAFSGHLTVQEAAELRRWIRGAEGGRRRGRGLRERLGDLLDGKEGLALLQAVEEAARCLPADGWRARVQGGAPAGAAERFLMRVRAQVLARTRHQRGGTELETDCHPLAPGVAEAASELHAALGDVQAAIRRLAGLLLQRLNEEAASLSSTERNRLESMARSLIRRGELMVGGWRGMLKRLLEEAQDGAAESAESETTEEAARRIVSWFSISFAYGQEVDIGMHAHWVDPTIPLAETVLREADSVIITSATLRDRPPDAPDDWQSAEARTGAVHLPWPVRRASFPSPFDYAACSRVFVVTDIDRNDMDQLAAAYRALFLAVGGGALGLFTAIARLRAVHKRILPALSAAGLPLYAQHVDAMDTGTLVDIFRAQPQACMLGTDAVRDGVDVPGESLRLLVMDRVPWPPPTILERARQQAFGRGQWTDMQVRLRLRQAFGRLIRKADDKGVFVMLDNRLASRFLSAFPEGTPVARVGLAQAIRETAVFLGEGGSA